MLPLADQLYLEFGKLIDDDILDEWMDTPNVQLDFKTPRSFILNRNFTPLWALLYDGYEVRRKSTFVKMANQ